MLVYLIEQGLNDSKIFVYSVKWFQVVQIESDNNSIKFLCKINLKHINLLLVVIKNPLTFFLCALGFQALC